VRPESVRAWLADRPLPVALGLAALFGAITPFCSCSSIPLFIGFIAAGIPLSVTLTFLIASPLINEVAVVMLGGSFGWGWTAGYVAAGLVMAVAIGAVLSRLHLEHQVQDFVFATPTAALHRDGHRITLRERVEVAREETADIFGRVWTWVILGVAIGAVIHGWVPAEFFATWAGPDNPLAVPIVTVLAIPLYVNGAGVVPIAEALWAKGMSLGTVMAFMMSAISLSIPEAIMLRRVLKPPLLILFFAVVAVGIMIIGFGFNLLFS
jgi:uncharacterized membrane protein YraQ (UPF0718 family)